ncbi:MAG: heavy metal translocating P-type ATPase [Actinomycetota bacterium]|nr:heavy metal translocating P-type ATPase [Actinomycetota bacterium]
MAGRLRLRVPPIAADPAYADRLAGLVRSEQDVLGVRVNRAAASIVVRYRPLLGDAALRNRLEEHVRSARDATLSGGRQADRTGAGLARWRGLGLPAVTAALALLGGPLGFAVPAPLIAGAVAGAALPIARRALHSVSVERKLNIDVLDMTAIVLTTLRGSYLAPAVMISLVEIGEAIRERTARASRREARDLLGSMAQSVWLERRGDRQRVPIEEVAAGDTVVVYPGDRIPVDGRILDGTGLIDEHQLTGEAMPVLREEGERVYASTLVREGHLHIGVEQVGDETRAGRIIRLMQDAPVHDTRIEDYAAKVADRAVLPAFLLSGAVLLATRNPARAASILITDLMTGIRVSVPTAVLAALTSAARQGILIRSGRALEQLAGVDAVVFDKTGTLTRGEPTIVAVDAVDGGMSPKEVLALAATVEQRLTHPVAEAVVRYARERGVSPGRRRGWRYSIGLGVHATIEGRTVLVGSDRLLEQEGIELDRLPPPADGGGSRIYVAADGRVCGAMTYLDPPRPESEAVVAALSESHGIEVHMLTGDKAETAWAVAGSTRIDRENTHAELFPEEKAEVVRGLRAAGKTVAFVGDGVNDLPALAYADISVSFGGATDVARETADIVLMDDDLRGLPHAITAGRHTLRLIRQNIGIVAGTNVGALGLATVGSLGPVAAAVIHNGSTIVAGANGLRPLAQPADPGRRRPRGREAGWPVTEREEGHG